MTAKTATLATSVGEFGADSKMNVTASYGSHHPYDFKLEPTHPEIEGTIEVTKDQIKEPYY